MDSHLKEAKIDARLRTMRILWAAMLSAVPFYALVGYMMRGDEIANYPPYAVLPADATSTDIALAVVFHVFGTLAAVAVGPLVARRFIARAEREQRPDLVQTGLVIGYAVCDVVALLGLLLLLQTGSLHGFMLMGAAALSIAVLFPRRAYLAAATYKKT